MKAEEERTGHSNKRRDQRRKDERETGMSRMRSNGEFCMSGEG